jgi:hypothetical protein
MLKRRLRGGIVFLLVMVVLCTLVPVPNTQGAESLVGRTFPSGSASTSSGSTPYNTFDNNLSTSWTSSAVTGGGDWIRFSFPSSQYVSAVQLVTTAPYAGTHTYSS